MIIEYPLFCGFLADFVGWSERTMTMLKHLVSLLFLVAVGFLFPASAKGQSVDQLGIRVDGAFIRGEWNEILFWTDGASTFSFGSTIGISTIPAGCSASRVPVYSITCNPGSYFIRTFVQQYEQKVSASLTMISWMGGTRFEKTIEVPIVDSTPFVVTAPMVPSKILQEVDVPVFLDGFPEEEVLGVMMDVEIFGDLSFSCVNPIPDVQFSCSALDGRITRVILTSSRDLRTGNVLPALRFRGYAVGQQIFGLRNIVVNNKTNAQIVTGVLDVKQYNVSGQVVYRGSDLPVPGIEVKLSHGLDTHQSQTDAQGKYQFFLGPDGAASILMSRAELVDLSTVVTAEDARVVMLKCLRPNFGEKVCLKEMDVDFDNSYTPLDAGLILKCAVGIEDSRERCGLWEFQPYMWQGQVDKDYSLQTEAVVIGDATHNWPGFSSVSAAAIDVEIVMPSMEATLGRPFTYTILLTGSVTSFGLGLNPGDAFVVENTLVDGMDTMVLGLSSDGDLSFGGFSLDPTDTVTVTLVLVPLVLGNHDIALDWLVVEETRLENPPVGKISVHEPSLLNIETFLPVVTN